MVIHLCTVVKILRIAHQNEWILLYVNFTLIFKNPSNQKKEKMYRQNQTTWVWFQDPPYNIYDLKTNLKSQFSYLWYRELGLIHIGLSWKLNEILYK